MSDQNLNEIAPAAIAAGISKVGKVAAGAKTAGKVASRAASMIAPTVGEGGKTSGQAYHKEEVEDQGEQLNEFKGSVPTPKTGPAKPASVVRPTGGIKPSFKPPSPGGVGAGVAAGVGLTLADKMSQTIGKPGQSRMSGLGIQGPPPTRTKPDPQAPPTPKIKPKPGPTEPDKQPETEPQPQQDPQKNPKRRGTGVKNRGAVGVNASTNKNQRGASMKNRKDAGSATNIGNTIKNVAGGTAAALGAAALTMMPKPSMSGSVGKLNKTSGRANYKEHLEKVCDYLIDEGYADTGVQAETIYEHMSDEWFNYICHNQHT